MHSPVIFDLRSNTNAAAWTLFSFLLLKKILAVTQSLTREVNLILYLNELFGSMMNYSSESIEKSGCPSSRTVYPIVFDVGFVNSMFFTTCQKKIETKKYLQKKFSGTTNSFTSSPKTQLNEIGAPLGM